VREVFVWPTVHNVLWQKLSKAAYDAVRDRMISQLETRYDHWRKRRHPQDETLFVYTVCTAERENWHTFEFFVDDTAADTCLIVVDVIHTLGKNRVF
jgi:hypothetical protein